MNEYDSFKNAFSSIDYCQFHDTEYFKISMYYTSNYLSVHRLVIYVQQYRV